MAINIFDEPAQQQFADTFVELPFQALFTAAGATEDRYNKRINEMEDMKSLYKDKKYLSWDKDAYMNLQDELKNKVVQFAESHPKLDSLEAQKDWYKLTHELQNDNRYNVLQDRYDKFTDYEKRKQKSVEEQGNQFYNFLDAESNIYEDISQGGIYGNQKTGFRYDNPNVDRLQGLTFTAYEKDLRKPIEETVNNMMTNIAESNPSWVTMKDGRYIVQSKHETKTIDRLNTAIDQSKTDYAGSNAGRNLTNKYMAMGYKDPLDAFNAGWNDLKNSVIAEYYTDRQTNTIKEDQYDVERFGWNLQNQGLFIEAPGPTGEIKVNYKQLLADTEKASENVNQLKLQWDKVKDNENDPNYVGVKQAYNEAIKSHLELSNKINEYQTAGFNNTNINDLYKRYTNSLQVTGVAPALENFEYADGKSTLPKVQFQELVQNGKTTINGKEMDILSIMNSNENDNLIVQGLKKGLSNFLNYDDNGLTFKQDNFIVKPTNKNSQVNKVNDQIKELIVSTNAGVLFERNGTKVQISSLTQNEGLDLSKTTVELMKPNNNSQPTWLVTLRDKDNKVMSSELASLSNDQAPLMKEIAYNMLGELQKNEPTEQTELMRKSAYTMLGQAEIGNDLREAAIYTLPENGTIKLGSRAVVIEKVPSAISDQPVYKLYDNQGNVLTNLFAPSGSNQYFTNENEISATFGYAAYLAKQQ